MTARLVMSRARLRAIRAAAREERCIAEVDMEGVTVGLIPEKLAQIEQDLVDVDTLREIDLRLSACDAGSRHTSAANAPGMVGGCSIFAAAKGSGSGSPRIRPPRNSRRCTALR